MRLIATVVGMSRAKFHCNRFTTVQDIFKITPVSFLAHIVQGVPKKQSQLLFSTVVKPRSAAKR